MSPSGLVLAEKSADSLISFSLHVTSSVSLATFKILPLSLTFAILITICLGVDLFGFIMFGTLCFLDLGILPTLGKFLAIISSNKSFATSSLSSLSGISIMHMLTFLTFSQKSLKLFLKFYFVCLFFSVLLGDFPLLSSK